MDILTMTTLDTSFVTWFAIIYVGAYLLALIIPYILAIKNNGVKTANKCFFEAVEKMMENDV
jgi:hypothetical protein